MCLSCLVCCGERDLWAGPQESQELLVAGAHLLQAHDLLHQQLDAHQDYQALRSSHPPGAKVYLISSFNLQEHKQTFIESKTSENTVHKILDVIIQLVKESM